MRQVVRQAVRQVVRKVVGQVMMKEVVRQVGEVGDKAGSEAGGCEAGGEVGGEAGSEAGGCDAAKKTLHYWHNIVPITFYVYVVFGQNTFIYTIFNRPKAICTVGQYTGFCWPVHDVL